MADMLNVAVSGLKAFQRALDTTSHNIANATTPGYSRQRVNLVTSEPQAMGALNLGRGVDVSSIDRYYDALLTAQMRGAASGFTRMETYASKAESLNNLFADSTTGLSASMQKFVNALQGVANTPNSTPARQVLLSEGKALVERLQSYDRRLDELEAEINTRLRGEAAAITTAAENIARLNEQIVRVQATTGSPANDLLDARDLELAELARHINVDVVEQGDGAVNVFIGNGQSLVVGQIAAKIVTEPDTFNPTRLSLAYQTGGSTASLKGVLSGGSVGGLLDFRRELLDPVRNELGQIAVGIADAVNAQHREGMDLRGQMGGDFFAIGGVQVLPAQKNSAPGATVTATRTGAADIDSRDYVLQYAGGAWSLRQADTGATVPMDGDGRQSVHRGGALLHRQRHAHRRRPVPAAAHRRRHRRPARVGHRPGEHRRGRAHPRQRRGDQYRFRHDLGGRGAGCRKRPRARDDPVHRRDALLRERRGQLRLRAGRSHRHQWLPRAHRGRARRR
jgi:flagellar hook-associated protein 1 FlgK